MSVVVSVMHQCVLTAVVLLFFIRTSVAFPLWFKPDLAQDVYDGHPMLVSGRDAIHFNWEGSITRVDIGHAGEYCVVGSAARTTGGPDELEEWFVQEVGHEGKVVYRYCSTPAPKGWVPLLIANTMTEVVPEAVGERPTQELQSYCFDRASLTLLAEFDLDEMLSTLYGTAKEENADAAIVGACLGPDDGMGLIVWYLIQDPTVRHGYEVGVWDSGRWIPLAMPSGAYCLPSRILVGPENRSVVKFGGSSTQELRFFDAKGVQLAAIGTSPRSLSAAVADWRRMTFLRLLVVSILALAAVALVGLIWWFGPLNRARRGA